MNSKLLIWILILILFGAIVAAIVIPQFTDAAQACALSFLTEERGSYVSKSLQKGPVELPVKAFQGGE